MKYIQLIPEDNDTFEQYKLDNPGLLNARHDVVACSTVHGFLIEEGLLNDPRYNKLKKALDALGWLDNLTVIDVEPETLYPDDGSG